MCILAEFSISAEQFALGSTLGSAGDVELALEPVVPVLAEVEPYVWVMGGDPGTFERETRADGSVSGLTRLCRAGDDTLYRVESPPETDGILALLADYGAAVLSATRLGRWRFRARFHDYDRLRGFHESCRAADVDVSLTRVSVVDESPLRGPTFDLTPQQREALLVALEGGHFEVPRRTDVSAIASTIGTSRRVAANRIRRGVGQVLRTALEEPGSRHER